MSLSEILRLALDQRASDVHLRATTPVRFRVDGKLAPREALGSPSADELRAFHSAQRPSRTFNHDDFAFQLHDESWRANASENTDGPALIIRRIDSNVPPLETIGLPPSYLSRLLEFRGLHLITGPTGSGKSTTLAAITRFLASQPVKIIELADPIEHRHPTNLAADIQQRELGTHFDDYPAAIRSAMRQDPDIIIVGEMRDKKTIAAVLHAASTGHMVFSTLHNETTPDAVSRLLDASFDNEQTEHRALIAQQLVTCVAQQLVPVERGGRVAACELFVMTGAIAALIRQGKTERLADEVLRGEKAGMVSMTHALGARFRSRSITKDVARAHAPDPKLFDLLFP